MLQALSIKFAVILVMCPTVMGYSVVQEQGDKSPAPQIYNGNSNEDAKVGLDDVAVAAGADKLIILIARLGSRESSQTVNRRRLKTARDYLKYTRSIATQRIVVANGERVNGQGRVEAYVDGKLYRIFLMGRNRDFAPEP